MRSRIFYENFFTIKESIFAQTIDFCANIL